MKELILQYLRSASAVASMDADKVIELVKALDRASDLEIRWAVLAHFQELVRANHDGARATIDAMKRAAAAPGDGVATLQ